MNNPPNNGLFENFQAAPPPEPMTFPTQPEQPAAKDKKKRGKKAAAKPAKKAKPEGQPAAPKKQKRASAATKDKAAPRFTMDQILLATSGLKEADREAFNKLVVAFHAMGKPSRDRILPALGKLFQE